MPTYRLHDTTGDDLGTIERPAPNVEPGDVVILEDGARRSLPLGWRRTALCSSRRDAVSPAQAVRDYLRMRGCSSDEISTVGSSALMWRGAVFNARKNSEAP